MKAPDILAIALLLIIGLLSLFAIFYDTNIELEEPEIKEYFVTYQEWAGLTPWEKQVVLTACAPISSINGDTVMVCGGLK